MYFFPGFHKHDSLWSWNSCPDAFRTKFFNTIFASRSNPLKGFNNGFKQRKNRPGFFRVNIGDEILPSYVGINNKASIRIPIKLTSTMGSERFFFVFFLLWDHSTALKSSKSFRAFFTRSVAEFLLAQRLSIFGFSTLPTLPALTITKGQMNHGMSNRSFPLEVNKFTRPELKGWKGDQPNDRGFLKVTNRIAWGFLSGCCF